MKDILLTHKTLKGIPVIELEPQDGLKHKPLVIMLHGYAGIKEFLLLQAYSLCAQGFFVVLPDAWGHGARSDVTKTADFIDSVINTSSDINRLIEEYNDDHRTDNNRTGLVGYSMGGCIIFDYLVSKDVRIKAAAPVIATPDWVSILESKEAYPLMLEHGIVSSQKGMEEMKKRSYGKQPADRLDNFMPVPLLIQNGYEDTLIPIKPVNDCYEYLKEKYTDLSEIVFIPYPGIGHADNVPMNMQIAAFMKKYLVI